LATFLSAVGRRTDALAPAKEAVDTLAPYFLALPDAFAAWMATMVQNYLTHSEDVGQEPDMELLAPILATFQAMQAEHEGGNEKEGEL